MQNFNGTGMKKEENNKRNTGTKSEYFSRSRSTSPKAYLGCDTCKLKNVKSNNKWSDCGAQERIKLKKSPQSPKSDQRPKVKLTDLCDEDKKRLVQLIEELTILADKNDQLKKKIEKINKEKQEQQKYILEQAELFITEKNLYISEIDKYKSKAEALEEELNSKISKFKVQEKTKDDEIAYLVRALQKSIKEKRELHGQMTSLKTSLKHSLESFQKLKAEVTALQYKEEQIRKYKSTSCQTDNTSNPKNKTFEDETEEEYLSTGNQEKVNRKSSLDIINVKLENVYKLLKKRRHLSLSSRAKCDSELFRQLKEHRSDKEETSEVSFRKNQNGNHAYDNRTSEADESSKLEDGSESDALKALDDDLSWVQVEKILKQVASNSKSNVNECTQTLEGKGVNIHKPSETVRECRKLNFLKNKVVQKNNLFKSPGGNQFDEDRLLEELFYSDQSASLVDYKRIKGTKIIINPPLPL